MPADSSLASRTRRHLADLQAHGLSRVMRPPSGIDLSSNDYLGLARDPRVTAAFVAGVAADGCGSTGSRLLRGDRAAFADAEAQFARFKGTERALFFSSGYMANLAVLSTFAEAGDCLCSDALNHASLIDAARLSRAEILVTPHRDANSVERLLAEVAASRQAFVVVESLYSMDGDITPLHEYARVCREHQAMLIVDEAHAVGVRGERGAGLLEEFGVDANACLSINAGGKALGVGGAFVAGPAWAIEYLVQRARPFVFSTAAPPALAHALLASIAIVAGDPSRRHALRAKSRRLRRALRDLGLAVDDDDSHIVPIMIGDNQRALSIAATLQAEGFDVRAIRPPTVPVNTSRLRVSVNATLDDATLDRFVATLRAALRAQAATAHV
jgi:8-amino-7-oxononanoate synthase